MTGRKKNQIFGKYGIVPPFNPAARSVMLAFYAYIIN